MDSLELAIAAAIARDSLPERECRGCGEMKGPGAFPRDASTRDGLYTRCKACAAAKTARWQAENPDKERERKARYYAEHADKVRERVARYYEERKDDPEFREKARERQARWRAKNAARERERKARWRAENAEKERERAARWRAENPDKVRASARKYRALKRRVYRTPYTEADILAGNGGICRYCDSAPATALDHFIPISWGGDDAPWNLVGACAPCNSSKLDRDPYEWLASRGVDLDAWEARHIAGWFDLPAKLWKIAKVYRPPAEEV